jgi:hypothetical protein
MWLRSKLMEKTEQLEASTEVEPVAVSKKVKKQAPVVVTVVATEESIHFDEWYATRRAAIPAHHRKEILLADFKARKVPQEATIKAFDEALKKYGVKLG